MYVVYCQNKSKSEYIVSEYLDTYFEVSYSSFLRVSWNYVINIMENNEFGGEKIHELYPEMRDYHSEYVCICHYLSIQFPWLCFIWFMLLIGDQIWSWYGRKILDSVQFLFYILRFAILLLIKWSFHQWLHINVSSLKSLWSCFPQIFSNSISKLQLNEESNSVPIRIYLLSYHF